MSRSGAGTNTGQQGNDDWAVCAPCPGNASLLVIETAQRGFQDRGCFSDVGARRPYPLAHAPQNKSGQTGPYLSHRASTALVHDRSPSRLKSSRSALNSASGCPSSGGTGQAPPWRRPSSTPSPAPAGSRTSLNGPSTSSSDASYLSPGLRPRRALRIRDDLALLRADPPVASSPRSVVCHGLGYRRASLLTT